MGWIPALLLALAGLHLSAAAEDYRLPGTVVPYHYELKLLYDIDPSSMFSFYGVADIFITAKKTTQKIVLHAQDFNVSERGLAITGESIDTPKIKSLNINDTYNFLTFDLDSSLKSGENYTLTVPFFGNLNYGLDGVYISNYDDMETQKKEYLIATQFEAISARKGFPCFDEPIYKATFSINIGHEKNYTAVSNMPLNYSSTENAIEDYWTWDEISQTFNGNRLSEFVWDHFDTSVPMSTYLVAFVVSKFAFVESFADSSSSSTKFRIWARKDAVGQTDYAAKIGPQVLAYFEEYFNISFPLPKQDMFAIPDFAAGAMENWGLITYRETALLYDREKSSFVAKERIAEVVAHELAHQWFGNLVTMKWWSDLWLNEGFATHMAAVGMQKVEPDWNAEQENAVDNIMTVLSLDALESSHPVSVPLDDPKRISEIFDEISYRKGSALIRMMSMFLGENVFREALTNYLNKYSYNNAEQDDLWQELTDVSSKHDSLPAGVTVKEIMDTWTTQTGVPLLSATRNYDANSVALTQTRLLHKSATPQKQSWWIPLRVLTAGQVGRELGPVQWLAKEQHEMNIVANSSEWILFNPDMIAPYRINYDSQNWEMLIKSLKSEQYSDIPVLGRVQLMSDAFFFAWNDMLTYDVALELITYLHHEDEYLPLSIGLQSLAPLDFMLHRTPGYGAFQKFVRKLIARQYTEGGLAKKTILRADDLNSVKKQALISSWACRAKLPGCEDNAMELFNSWMSMENPDMENPIPLDLRSTVYCVAIYRGGVVEWRFTLSRLQRSNVAAERAQLQRALTCTREVWLLAQYLEWTVQNDTIIRQQDITRVISNIAGSSVGYYVAKDFIYDRIEDIYSALNGQGRRLGGMMKSLLGQFTMQRELDEFLTWKEQNAKYLEESKLALSQAMEAAKVNIDWLKRNQQTVVDKLRYFAA